MSASVASLDRILLLFSSNIRPRYEQDVLNVLAAPSGLHYGFRYRASWLNDAARDAWTNNGLDNAKAVIHFSLQQEAQFHDPVLIPVRLATIVETKKLGEVYLADFSVGRQISLRAPSAKPPTPASYAAEVRRYNEYLREHSVDRPYDRWASLVNDFTADDQCPLDQQTDQFTLFQRTAEFLQLTSSYKRAVFYLVEGIKDTDGKDVKQAKGAFELASGKSYELQIFQAQPKEVPAVATFEISANDAVVRIIGSKRFDVASEYAQIKIPIWAVAQPENQPRVTDVAIESDQVQGPRVRLPIVVHPPLDRRIASSGVALTALLLAGLPGVWFDVVKVLFVVGGAILAAGALFFLGIGAPKGSAKGD